MQPYMNCMFKSPSICWHDMIQGIYKPIFWFDSRQDCRLQGSGDLAVYKRAAKSTKIVSLPLTNKFSFQEQYYQDKLLDKVTNDMQSATQEEINNGEREVFYDFRTNPNGEVIIKLRDLSKTKEFEGKFLPHNDDFPNVLNIFIDTVSRNRLYRQLPNLVNFFRKYIPENEKTKMVYEYFRMHSIQPFTETNLKASLYGTDNPKVHSKRIDTEYRESGYVTGETYNSCSTSAKFTNCKIIS